jgi:purine nucleosidase
MPYIIDTDLGDDPDDALALALALAEEMDIQAVTTVRESPEIRARLVQSLLASKGREDISVAAGCGNPLVEKSRQALPLFSHLTSNEQYWPLHRSSAAHLIAQLLESDPPPTLITLGPLTNIALVALWRPDLATRMHLVSMGGALSRSRPEFNMRWDPVAAHIVLMSGASVCFIGLDVTLSCPLDIPLRNQIFSHATSTSAWLQRAIEVWLTHQEQHEIYLHDPLAVAVALDPDLAIMKPFDIQIELYGEHTRGHTVPRNTAGVVCASSGDYSIQMCVQLDYERFREQYACRIGR